MGRITQPVLVLLLLFISVSVTDAQVVPPAGIYIDADGVIHARPDAEAVRRGKIRFKGGAGEEKRVSLVEIAARAQKEYQAGGNLSLKTRAFDGLVRVDLLIVDPSTNDLLIEGPAEEIDDTDPFFPRGKRSGRTCLRLDDFVVALQTIGPGKRNRPLGCSIELPSDAPDRMMRAAAPFVSSQSGDARTIINAMHQAIGPQQVLFFGLESTTPLAMVCLSADLRLKRLALGLDPSPVRRVRSHLSLARERDPAYNRWWFVADYEPIDRIDGGSSYRLAGPRLRVLASDSPTDVRPASPSAQKFTASVNDHMDELCAGIPEFAALQNAADVIVLSALIREDRLAERVHWDLDWLLKDYPLQELPAVEEAEPLVNLIKRSSSIQVSAGGVRLDADSVLFRRERAE